MKNIDIYLDGPSHADIKKYKSPLVKGYTYNPSLMSQLNVKNYSQACRQFSKKVEPKCISLEVFADDEAGMIRQAIIISNINKNIYVKIPITYTNGKYTTEVLKELVSRKIKLNITAIFNIKQIIEILPIVKNSKCILSIFAGRIHDMGNDASLEISKISKLLKRKKSNCKILWASTRQIYDLVMAKNSGCHIITMAPAIFSKLKVFKKNWKDYSLETVKTFYADALKSKFKI
ncbi:transaldolase [Candidatus Pelagibacter ubique]|nr:transaldolase [Candidatus Pelagibacter ubique]